MKNRNLTRILVLALALVMLFAVVACDNGSEPEATGENTTAAATTTKAATTTAKKTTTAPKATTATTPAATTTMALNSVQLVSNFDGNGDGTNETYTFYNYLPEQFTTAGTVLIAGKDHLADDIGVTPLEQTYGDVKITHYYLNNNEIRDPDGNVIPDANKKLTWKFTVTEAGTYDFCFNMRMKDDAQRGNVITIDGGTPYKMDFKFATTADAAAVRDAVENSYMTGFSAELTAGEHTIQMTINTECPKTFHFRNIYLAKQVEVAEPITVALTAADFSTTLPAAYANAVKVAGSVCETGSTVTNVSATRDNLTTVPGTPNVASANGAIKLIATESPSAVADSVWHYYIDKSVDADKNIENCYITWNFTLAEAGTYTVVSYHRLKADKRDGKISIDGGAIVLDFSYDASTIATTDLYNNGKSIPEICDAYSGAYLTWTGVELELAAGEHTITYTCTGSSIHWRDFYFLKKAA